MKVLVDADLILELFLNRSGIAIETEELWQLIKTSENDFYVSETGLKKIIIILAELGNYGVAHDIRLTIEEAVKICKSDTGLIQKARTIPAIDFESAIELACTERHKIDVIVTQNPGNFSGSNSCVWPTSEFLDLFSETISIQAKYKNTENQEDNIKPEIGINEDHKKIGNKKNILDIKLQLKSERLKIENSKGPLSNTHQDGELKRKWWLFEKEFTTLLEPYSTSSRSIFSFIRSRLNQYSLANQYDESYIINEVYIRAFEAVFKNKKDISSPIAWIRSTAFNFIRELSRNSRKELLKYNYDTDRISNEIEDTLVSDKQIKSDIESIKIAFHNLDSDEQLLLNLKVVQGLSWEKIRIFIRDNGNGDIPEITLRKRKQRALKRLRQIFHSVESKQA